LLMRPIALPRFTYGQSLILTDREVLGLSLSGGLKGMSGV
jgi:hypothetical protein